MGIDVTDEIKVKLKLNDGVGSTSDVDGDELASDASGEGNICTELERDSSGDGKTCAELDRDSSGDGKTCAELDRDNSGDGKTCAELDRDSSGDGNTCAELDRDSSGDGNTCAELDRDSSGDGNTCAELAREESLDISLDISEITKEVTGDDSVSVRKEFEIVTDPKEKLGVSKTKMEVGKGVLGSVSIVLVNNCIADVKGVLEVTGSEVMSNGEESDSKAELVVVITSELLNGTSTELLGCNTGPMLPLISTVDTVTVEVDRVKENDGVREGVSISILILKSEVIEDDGAPITMLDDDSKNIGIERETVSLLDGTLCIVMKEDVIGLLDS